MAARDSAKDEKQGAARRKRRSGKSNCNTFCLGHKDVHHREACRAYRCETCEELRKHIEKSLEGHSHEEVIEIVGHLSNKKNSRNIQDDDLVWLLEFSDFLCSLDHCPIDVADRVGGTPYTLESWFSDGSTWNRAAKLKRRGKMLVRAFSDAWDLEFVIALCFLADIRFGALRMDDSGSVGFDSMSNYKLSAYTVKYFDAIVIQFRDEEEFRILVKLLRDCKISTREIRTMYKINLGDSAIDTNSIIHDIDRSC